jgi:hypothetical protein
MHETILECILASDVLNSILQERIEKIQIIIGMNISEL